VIKSIPIGNAVVVRVATPGPSGRVAVPSRVAPSKNDTEPVGVPTPAVTVAVRVTADPKVDGLALLVTTVVVVDWTKLRTTSCPPVPPT